MTDRPSAAAATPQEILDFWGAAGPAKWFLSDPEFDAEVRTRFLSAHQAAAAGKLQDWQASPEGTLALLVLLDQFPRNIFRGEAQAFATDQLARSIAGRALAQGFDARFPLPMQHFFYLPFMHSEEIADQERCVALFRAMGDAEGLKHALHHADIVRRFGRFPHRNAVLGRSTTRDEQEFLDAGGFAGNRRQEPSAEIKGP